MNQKITFATILVAFSVFFICFTNASPIELSPRAPGDVAYVDFTKSIRGRATFTELYGKIVRALGQFSEGFPDRTSKYEYQISGLDRTVIPSTDIFPPGTIAFQEDHKNKTIKSFAGKTLTFYRNGKIIESEIIKLIK
ncbi:hypothetical protein Glove_84g34 [Diversispora epigaea]|uniref:Uncharacterized protein n=1 Tax=Diversispora epigaea TaxID=1348612 RepID=A0A397JBL3_9GLOM|nr:hypothetical protein Glove_84g34 [Diversispora epigaea]